MTDEGNESSREADALIEIQDAGSRAVDKILKGDADKEAAQIQAYDELLDKIGSGQMAENPGQIITRMKWRALDRVRGFQPDKDVRDREFRKALDEGLFDDTEAGRAAFDADYETSRSLAHPKHASDLPESLASHADGGQGLSLIAEVLCDCVRRESPNSILIMKAYEGMTWLQIAASEQARKIQDQKGGTMDPAGYRDTTSKARTRFELEKREWRSEKRRRVLVREIRSRLAGNDGGFVFDEIKEMYRQAGGR